jgi:hypothetical protein
VRDHCFVVSWDCVEPWGRVWDSQSQAEGLQNRAIGYFVAFAKTLDLKNIRHSLALFNLREPSPPNPIALIVGSACCLTGEALDSDTREVKFFPKSSKGNPPDSSRLLLRPYPAIEHTPCVACLQLLVDKIAFLGKCRRGAPS